MKKIFYTFLIVIAIGFISGCKKNSKFDDLIESGKIVTVRYVANGGKYSDREGITVVDMFDPKDYQKDSNNEIHIKLVSPTDDARGQGTYLTRTGYFLIGWYTNREIVKNASGNAVDEEGNELILKDEKYYLLNDEEKESTPAYTYSGYWDFTKNTIDYKEEMGRYELQLYAAWSKKFSFDYYAKKEGSWEKIGSTSFDYMTTNLEGSETADQDTIFLPSWNDGALVYTHKYQNNQTYTFPKISGYSFKKAYTDEDFTDEIIDELKHPGTIDFEHGVALNPVKNVYIDVEQGEKYYISKAEQLIKYAQTDATYILEQDLDFTNLAWPSVFDTNEFTGTFTTADGTVKKIINATVEHASANATVGGLFGGVAANATIENINFENATLDLSYCGMRVRNIKLGLFSGDIDENANIINVTVSGSVKLGNCAPGQGYLFALLANGKTTGITEGEIKLFVYGILGVDAFGNKVYEYTIDKDDVKVEEGIITFTQKNGTYPEEIYEIK